MVSHSSRALSSLWLAKLEVGLLGVKGIGLGARNPSNLAAGYFETVLIISHIIFLQNKKCHFC